MICQALRPFLRTSLKICDLNEIDLFDTGRREQRGRSNILEEASVWSPPPELRPHRFNSGILPSLRFDQAAKQIYQDSSRSLFDPQRPRRTYCLQRRPIAIQAHIIALATHPIQYYKCHSTENFCQTRPKPAYGRQGLDSDRWARIQFSQVHFETNQKP